jgi:hypothetical protein
MAYIRSIVTGKGIRKFHAEIRRTGYESKSATLPTEAAAKKWIRDSAATSELVKAGSGMTVKQLIDEACEAAVASRPPISSISESSGLVGC